MVPLGKHESLAKLQGTWQIERGQTRDWRQKESPDNEDTSGHPEVNTSDSAEQAREPRNRCGHSPWALSRGDFSFSRALGVQVRHKWLRGKALSVSVTLCQQAPTSELSTACFLYLECSSSGELFGN